MDRGKVYTIDNHLDNKTSIKEGKSLKLSAKCKIFIILLDSLDYARTFSLT